jgi:autotransporter-associated beta strand protein
MAPLPTTAGAGTSAGDVAFFGTSTAANGIFTSKGGQDSGAEGGAVFFSDASTADSGTFTLEGGAVSGASGASATFSQGGAIAVTAGNATFTINGGATNGANGGIVVFQRTNFFGVKCTAGNATLIANGGLGGGAGGTIALIDDSSGGTARIEVFGNGFLDISGHIAPGVATGSIEGDGLVFLGSNNVSVGSNHRDTTFSGVIQDGGFLGGVGGSLTKVGTGKLVLRHRNTYTGGTIIKRGILMVNNIGASGTGSGPVAVNGGRLGGVGTIAGAVTVGSGSGRGAVLSPGYQHSINPGTLTTQSSLTFNADATYEFELNSSSATADEVIANGVTINNGAQFSFRDVRSGILPIGTVFTVIDNSAATPIAGTFSNLPDGSIFTANGNTYQMNYEGGDGNDLTLAVVP